MSSTKPTSIRDLIRNKSVGNKPSPRGLIGPGVADPKAPDDTIIRLLIRGKLKDSDDMSKYWKRVWTQIWTQIWTNVRKASPGSLDWEPPRNPPASKGEIKVLLSSYLLIMMKKNTEQQKSVEGRTLIDNFQYYIKLLSD